MNKHLTALVSSTTFLFAAAGGAFAAQDGGLPLYPHGTVVASEADIPAAALAQGVPYNQTTTDSVATVDRWFAAHVPKACTRLSASGAVQYKCPGGSIVVQTHGGTFISYVPKFPGM